MAADSLGYGWLAFIVSLHGVVMRQSITAAVWFCFKQKLWSKD
jgi:hypothetical protein